MSRNTTTTTSSATGQLTTPQSHIFLTKIRLPDGKESLITSSESLNNTSVRINSRDNGIAIFLLMGLCLQQNGITDNGSELMRLINRVISYRGIPADVWKHALTFIIPTDERFGHEQLVQTGNYAVAIKRPSFFPRIEMNPSFVVDAAMRGQEDIVLNIINADPSYLLKKAKVKNSVDIEYEVTPLQAAIMTGDAQMAEKMREHFARLTTDLEGNPIDGVVEMEKQFKEIYTKSLRNYLEKQMAKIARLSSLKSIGSETVIDELAQARMRHYAYRRALQSDDTRLIFEAHTQAQKDNAFDFKPYADAIAIATQAELDDAVNLIGASFTQTDDARAKPFDQLTLVEKLNRFREEFVKHMQSEIIFNPNHIASALAVNEKKYEALASAATDVKYKKRTVIFLQLVGFSQRVASEPYKQDIRQGTCNLTEDKEPRARPSFFNVIDCNDKITRNSRTDVSLVDSSVIDGVGFKFGVGCEGLEVRGGAYSRIKYFQNLCGAKTSSFQNLCSERQFAPAHA